MSLFKKLKFKKRSVAQKEGDQSYFARAQSWNDDIYTAAIVRLNRYKTAFFAMAGLSAALTFCIASILALEHTELVVVHQGADGFIWVTPTHQKMAVKLNQAQIEAEIARYVQARESYDPTTYEAQYKLVELLSSSEVANEYQATQKSNNPHALINILGRKGYRTVSVKSVLFLDNGDLNPKGTSNHKNLAQVNFAVTDHWFGSSKTETRAYSAIISWRHIGTPEDPNEMWQNWDGFQATKYLREAVNPGN